MVAAAAADDDDFDYGATAQRDLQLISAWWQTVPQLEAPTFTTPLCNHTGLALMHNWLLS